MTRGVAVAPATLSNLGPGFDVLGLALDQPRERVEATITGEPGVIRIRAEGPFGDRVPLDPAKNVAAYAARRVLERAGAPFADKGLELLIEKVVPPGSGLGSSAASGVAGAVAAARAIAAGGGGPLDPDALLAIARDAEQLAAGSAHLDNVSPALFGGFVAVVSTDPPRVRRLEIPTTWRFAVVLPDLEVRTADARAVLPERIPREDAVQNLRNLSGLIDAAHRGDLEAFSRHLVDRIAVPYRRHLWPYLDGARSAALAAGAPALEISGSGPAVFAPCDSDATAERVAEAIVRALAAMKIDAQRWIARVSSDGALG